MSFPILYIYQHSSNRTQWLGPHLTSAPLGRTFENSYNTRERWAKEKSGNLSIGPIRLFGHSDADSVLVNRAEIVLTRGEPHLLAGGLCVQTCHELLLGLELA